MAGLQRNDVIYVFVSSPGRSGDSPSSVARPDEIAAHMKTQCNGRGHGALHEDQRQSRPGSKYDHRLPDRWRFSEERLKEVASNHVLQQTGHANTPKKL